MNYKEKTSDGLTIAASHFSDERDYWLNKLTGDIVKSYFPYDHESGGEKGLEREIETLTFAVPGDLSSRLTKAGKDSDSRLFMILTAGLVQLLRIFTGTEDIIVGIPISKQAVEGELLNTMLPVRIGFEAGMTFRDLLMKVRQTMIEAGENQNYPLEMLPNELNMGEAPDTGEGEFPLFDVILLLENIHDKSYIRRIRTNMVFSFVRAGREIEGVVEYNALKYLKETVKRIYNYFMSHLYDVLANPDMNLSSIDLLSGEDRQRFLFDFNRTETNYPADKTIRELFEMQAAHSGDKIAVVSAPLFITYSQLNVKANHAARLLREKGIKEETIAAVMGHRSPEMMAVLLGILKAGGAYLPINAQDPIKRITYILNDSKAHLLMTDKQAFEKNSEVSGTMSPGFVNIIEDLLPGKTRGEASNPGPYSRPGSPAYVIYTSGTTGKPKGVIIEQRNLVNYIFWAAKMYVREENADFPFYTSFSFDMSVTSIFTPLVTGNAVVIYGGDDREFILEKVIDEDRVGVVKATPAHLKMIREKAVSHSNIKRFIVGGEELGAQLAKEISENFKSSGGGVEIYNEYGPTEATVACMIYRYDMDNDTRHSVPIGIPADNARVYLLNTRQKPVPLGVAGELYIAGHGLARGYLNNPSLTAERFPVDPFITGEKMYKTGDLARRLPDGTIEFLGRKDHQVKIRGFRIELGEIESQLRHHEGIKEAVVTAKKDDLGDTSLCAYFVSSGDLNVPQLREYLLNKLPDYMIPRFFMEIEQIPVSRNGKLNKKVLPEPEITSEEEYAAPRNDMETKLAGIYAELLDIEDTAVGINHSFFEIGGHSLSATTLVMKIEKEFNVRLSLQDIFRSPTIGILSSRIQSPAAAERSEPETLAAIVPAEEKKYYVLSSAQKRLYVIHQIDTRKISYNIPLVVTLAGRVNRKELEGAFCRLIERHEALRTAIHVIENEAVQIVYNEVDFSIDYFELNEAEAGKKMQDYFGAFDLTRAPLLKVGLIKLQEETHLLLINMHHIISDGLSMDIFVRETLDILAGKELPPLELQYKDYSEWQEREREKGAIKQQEIFWLKEFADEIPVLYLPSDYPRPTFQSTEGHAVDFEVPDTESAALKKIAAAEEVTSFMLLLALYNILLSKLSGQEDIVVGVPVAGRRYQGLENIIGIFVNTLAMRNVPSGSKTFKQFLAQVKEKAIAGSENQDYQFEDLVNTLTVNRDTSRNPLFDVMFELENVQYQEVLDVGTGGLKIRPYHRENPTSKFDLSLTAVDKKDSFSFSFQYCTKLFKKETIERFIRHFKKIISGVIHNPDREIGDIEIISEAEKRQILFGFNDTQSDFPGERMIHRVFEERAVQMPDRMAVIGPGSAHAGEYIHLSYAEVNRISNRWVKLLRARDVKPDTIVGIMAERSLEMIVGILGTLKAGGAYLPIDPAYPEERIQFMLKDSSAGILLSEGSEVSKVRGACDVIHLSEIGKEILNVPTHPLTHSPTQLCYVIYTSGSTGKPKGVMVQHESVVNILHHLEELYPLGEDDVYLLKTNYTFDVSVTELFGWFFGRGKLVILSPGEERDPGAIAGVLKRYRVTHTNFVPSMFGAFMEFLESRGESYSAFPDLRFIFLAGEALPPEMVRTFVELNSHILLENIYGPTEAAIYASKYSLSSPHWRETGRVPIGKPLQNIALYILDKQAESQPIGIQGELCIAGAGLARGYLNQPPLTAEKFVSSSLLRFSASQLLSFSLYRTGDLARWLPDGNIEFFGRMDHQVKVRGFRIEPGEIESRLTAHPSIDEAVVMPKADEKGDLHLCGYIISNKAFSTPELREYLSQELPDYMIPSVFVFINKVPLTPSGKVDRKALLEVEGKTVDTEIQYLAPRNPLEETLVEIWEKVLGRKQIGINENFFMIGGDSIKIIQVIARMNRLGYQLEMRDVFRNPFIRGLAPVVRQLQREIDQSPVSGIFPLTPVQQWFFESYPVHRHHFNQAMMLYTGEFLEFDTIQWVIIKLQAHHDALRITFQEERGEFIQSNHGPGYPFSLEEYDYRGCDYEKARARLEAKACDIQASINLETGPLMKWGLFHLNDGDRLLMVIHHLVIDGLSWRILFEDMETLYQLKKTGEENQYKLPLKTDSYKTWAAKLAGYANSKKFLKEKKYWARLETASFQPLSLDVEAGNDVEDEHILSFRLNEEETELLLTKVNAPFNTTINDILLTALGLGLKEIFGIEKVLVDLEAHGREEILTGINISRTVGWFTAVYPVILDLSYETDLARQIIEIKERLHQVPNKGIGYGILRYLTSGDNKKELTFRLNPQVSFNYLGQFDTVFGEMGFKVAQESTGNTISKKSRRKYTLDFAALISDKCLIMQLTYSREQFKRETIKNVLNRINVKLCDIIAFCKDREKKALTPSDLDYKDLSIDELENIFN